MEQGLANGAKGWAWAWLPVTWLATGAALADVYTWVDAAGNVNVSNLAPPAGAHVTAVAHESAAAIARAEAARKAAQDAEVRALSDRVADLERATEQVQRGALPPLYAQAPPPPLYGQAPPPQYVVTMMPDTPDDVAPPQAQGCAWAGCGLPVFAAPLIVVSPGFNHRGRMQRRPYALAHAPRPPHAVAATPVPAVTRGMRRG